MTTLTARYGLAKIVLGSDNVDVVTDFNNNWDALDLKVGSQVCTSSTLPSTPPQGMQAMTTDTSRLAINFGTSGSPIWKTVNTVSDWINVVLDWGADPTGATNSTTALQNAINAGQLSTTGCVLYFPPGVYLSDTLTITGNGLTFRGATELASVIKKNSNGVLLSFTGTTSPSTGATHVRYCAVENLGFNGNSKTGSVFQLYYCDNFRVESSQISSNSDVVVDGVEWWDSRFINMNIVNCGGGVNSTTAPNVWIRNSSAVSGVGASTGNSNNIHFIGCRFEGSLTGSIWIAQGVSNSSNGNNFKIISCKFESDAIQGGPLIQTDNTTKNVLIDDCNIQMGGFAGGYSTAQIAISLGGGNHVLSNTSIGNGAAATISDGVFLHAVGGSSITVENVTGGYTTAPTTGHLFFDASATGSYNISNTPTFSGTLYAGSPSTSWFNNPVASSPPTNCIFETFPRCMGSTATATQTIGVSTGVVEMVPVWLPAGMPITNLNWITGTTAAVGPTHWWLGLANSSRVQVASTADQLTAAIGASSLITKALTSVYTTTYTGLYYALLSVTTSTTQPTSTGLPVPIASMNIPTPVVAGASATVQSTPGTNGTTTYAAPAAAGGIPYIYGT